MECQPVELQALPSLLAFVGRQECELASTIEGQPWDWVLFQFSSGTKMGDSASEKPRVYRDET